MSCKWLCALVAMEALLATPGLALKDGYSNKESDAFVKEGMCRYNNPVYQYEWLGLGGTTLRVGPDGFTGSAAPGVSLDGGLEHKPFLAYQYWWDEDGHRHYPFNIIGGYGETDERTRITGFRHRLDIRTGVMTIDLTMTDGHNTWRSNREEFIAPNGVLVVRVTDSPGASAPFRLSIDANKQVRLYHNGGIYAGRHEPWVANTHLETNGFTVQATRSRSCLAILAVAMETARPVVDPSRALLGPAKPGSSTTFYLAPASSYESDNAQRLAWRRADEARSTGFAGLRNSTAAWWRAYYGRSSIKTPDDIINRWLARSLYYHGVFFGNTDVPPGCNGTGPLFSGTVCPEYDLVFSQLALLYTGHFNEAGRVAHWLGRILPRAERYATEGLTLHKVSVKYSSGAIYGPLIGYDGTIPTPPTEGEGIWAYERYPGANAALMALSYLDWTGDTQYEDVAKRILKEATAVSVADLAWRPDLNGYAGKYMGNSVQLAAARFGLTESVRRGVAENDWQEMAKKVVVPTADFNGERVIVVGPGMVPAKGAGDAPWLSDLWWYGNIDSKDPLAQATYDMIRESTTGNYVFNNGWMAVYAAKLRNGSEALKWLRNLLRPGVTLFDDTCLGEIVYGADDFKKTPEIGAHASLICGLAQMLVDSDSSETISVFPAVPEEWQEHGVSFANLAVPGDIVVSGKLTSSRAQVIVENRASESATREVRVRLPEGFRKAKLPSGFGMDNGWVLIPTVELAPKQRISLDIHAR